MVQGFYIGNFSFCFRMRGCFSKKLNKHILSGFHGEFCLFVGDLRGFCRSDANECSRAENIQAY